MVKRLSDVFDVEPDDPIQLGALWCGGLESLVYRSTIRSDDGNSQYATGELHNDTEGLAAIVRDNSSTFVIPALWNLKIPNG